MKHNGTFYAVAFSAATCFANTDAGIYAKPDFATYQPILERMPFGSIPDITVSLTNTPDARAEAAAKASLAQKIHMSAMRVAPDGRVAVGFTDLSTKPPANYYLRVGESEGGWTILDADYEDETAKIAKDGIEVDLKYGKGLIEPPAPARTPGLVAAGQGVNAMNVINATVPPALPGQLPDRPLPPGLRRETAPASPTPSAAVTATPGAGAARPATSPSYTELRDARLKEEQLKKEETERRQKEMMERVAAAAAQNEIRRQKEEAAAAAEQDGDTTHVEDE